MHTAPVDDDLVGSEALSVSRRWPTRAVPALLALAPAAAVASLAGEGLVPFGCLALWAVATLGRTTAQRAMPSVAERTVADARTVGALWALIGLAAVAGLFPLSAARGSLSVILVAGLATVALRRFQPRELKARRVVLVGSHHDVEAYVASGVVDDVVAGCHVVDAGAALAVQPTLLVPTTTSLGTLVELVAQVEADAVLVLPGAGVTSEVVRDLTWMFEDTAVTVGIVCPVSSVSAHRLRTSVSGAGTVLELGVPRATVRARAAKGALDRIGASALLLLVSPLLLLLWLAVRLDTDGPGLFVQTRVGRNGQPFRMFKLRTMHPNAESLVAALADDNESDGMLFKIRRDPRVTRVGYWLRRSSLDELPQLINVVRGDMSLVGPRPALPEEVAGYDSVARRRLVVKPGITGLWQVSGRSDLLWEESLRLDLYYADNWRLMDDISIALRTVGAVTKARGAY